MDDGGRPAGGSTALVGTDYLEEAWNCREEAAVQRLDPRSGFFSVSGAERIAVGP